MSEMTQTPADVRERVAKEVYLWEATRFGAAESWALRRWLEESNTRRKLYFNVADRILAILSAPRGEEKAWCAFLAAMAEFEAAANLWADPEGPSAEDMARLDRARERVIECARALAALSSEAQGEDGRDSVWVASAGVVYESGDAVDAFATEDEAVAWLRAQIDEWLRERLQWVEDEEEIEEIRSNAPEIEFGDGAHVVEAISGEWWKVQRYDLRAARRGEAPGEEV
ncbi:MAG: hypothetical protein DIU79_16680 [Actinobacteria bacterium]|nr:MAG: hypothetical protein DIU79_16680 [Actinomycetota bacterium]